MLAASSSSSNLRIKSFECHPLQVHFITRLFAIVVKVTKLSFFLVCLTGKLIWAPFCKKAKNTNPLAKIPAAATAERYTYSGPLQTSPPPCHLLPWQSHPPTHRSTRHTILQQSISPQQICKSSLSLSLIKYLPVLGGSYFFLETCPGLGFRSFSDTWPRFLYIYLFIYLFKNRPRRGFQNFFFKIPWVSKSQFSYTSYWSISKGEPFLDKGLFCYFEHWIYFYLFFKHPKTSKSNKFQTFSMSKSSPRSKEFSKFSNSSKSKYFSISFTN